MLIAGHTVNIVAGCVQQLCRLVAYSYGKLMILVTLALSVVVVLVMFSVVGLCR